MRFARAAVIAVLATACDSSVNGPTPLGTIQLTASEAAAINSGIQSITASTPELSFLADSANLVLKTGAVVDSAAIDTNLGGGPYYAVSLQRAISRPTNPFATFDVIYFNNPSSPTRFVIISVYAQGQVGPPDGAIATIGSPTGVLTANVHFYQIDGSAVTHWRATAGSLELGNGLRGGSCPGFSGDVVCETADLLIGGDVTASTRETGTASGSPTMSIVNGFVSGIKLIFTVF